MLALLESLSQARLGQFKQFTYEYEFRCELREIWGPPPIPPSKTEDEKEASPTSDSDIRFSRKTPDPTEWSIAFTPMFRKSVATADKKLQGRVLEAISELSEDPLSLQGNTKKPLTGEFKGLWRYRVGDYRIVFQQNA